MLFTLNFFINFIDVPRTNIIFEEVNVFYFFLVYSIHERGIDVHCEVTFDIIR